MRPSTATTELTLILDASDPITRAEPVRWAAEHLRTALAAHGIAAVLDVRHVDAGGAPGLVITGRQSAAARAALDAAGLALPDAAEAMALVATPDDRTPADLSKRADASPSVVSGRWSLVGGRSSVIATGSDVRGVVYAVLELADRAACATDAASALRRLTADLPVVEQPANRIRGLMRLFTSDVEDRGWYHDRGFWQEYLTMAATHRYNRFQLALGIGFDFARHMRDSYFYFAYPFLMDVPGYEVRATGVSDAKRERNLETLRFIARETRRRGLHFQLGLWAQVYEFAESPDVNHSITGLTAENHAAYCRDAVRALLEAVPEIDGLTLRVHGESGIPEGSYEFWQTLFAGIARRGRRVEIDMHAKGIDQRMIDLALATGQPVVVSPKFWAEHMGLPYQQTDIRAVERPGEATGQHARLMALSTGSRRFTRYGYADLLSEERRHGILFRVWPGTHRLLLWGDPITGRAYGRAFSFGGADGGEWFEPLSFSGRRGSGLPDGRNPYADASLRPEGPCGEWKKYSYTYRLWGRLLYNPDAAPETWRRQLRLEFGVGAEAAEAALASASRILPLVTTAHHPSAANNRYWPEIYTDMPIVDESRPQPYGDTPSPKRFGTVSALDPEIFSTVEEYVAERLVGGSARYSPLDVAQRLEDLAHAAVERLGVAASLVPDAEAPGFRRWAIDIRIEVGLGRFFADKIRAAVGYALYVRTGNLASLRDALGCYHEARAAWVEVVRQAQGVYKEDLTFGPEAVLRGHWHDRLAAIDEDIADMEDALRGAEGGDAEPSVSVTLRALLDERRPESVLQHEVPAEFTPGSPLAVTVRAPAGVTGVRLRYRHVNQAERFQELAMDADDGRERGWMRATIPGDYTRSPFALQYFFELRDKGGAAWLWPGLAEELDSVPYFFVSGRQRDPP